MMMIKVKTINNFEIVKVDTMNLAQALKVTADMLATTNPGTGAYVYEINEMNGGMLTPETGGWSVMNEDNNGFDFEPIAD